MWKKAISLVLSVGLYVTLFSGTAGASEKLQDYVDGSSTFVPIDYDVDLDSLVYYNEYLAEQGELPPARPTPSLPRDMPEAMWNISRSRIMSAPAPAAFG